MEGHLRESNSHLIEILEEESLRNKGKAIFRVYSEYQAG